MSTSTVPPLVANRAREASTTKRTSISSHPSPPRIQTALSVSSTPTSTVLPSSTTASCATTPTAASSAFSVQPSHPTTPPSSAPIWPKSTQSRSTPTSTTHTTATATTSDSDPDPSDDHSHFSSIRPYQPSLDPPAARFQSPNGQMTAVDPPRPSTATLSNPTLAAIEAQRSPNKPNRWSQSSASSGASSSHRKGGGGGLSKRLSLGVSSPFGSWGRKENRDGSRAFTGSPPDHSPTRHPFTATSHPINPAPPRTAPTSDPSTLIDRSSPSRGSLNKTRQLSANTRRAQLSRPPSQDQPLPALSALILGTALPRDALRPLSQTVGNYDSQMTGGNGRPGVVAPLAGTIAAERHHATRTVTPDEARPRLQSRDGSVSSPSFARPNVQRTATAPTTFPSRASPGSSARSSLTRHPPALRTANSFDSSAMAPPPQLDAYHRSSTTSRTREHRESGHRLSHRHSRERERLLRASGLDPSTSGRSRKYERDRPERVPSQKAMLSKALQKANAAVVLDNAQNFEGATEAYDQACSLLQQVMMRSSGDEDRRKLEAIRKTYTTRIRELRSLPSMAPAGDKALPPRPDKTTDDRQSRDAMESLTEEDLASTPRAVPTTSGPMSIDRTIAASLVPRRRESLLPSPFDRSAQSSPVKKATATTSRSAAARPSKVESSLRRPDMVDDVPPALSPRRALSPTPASPERIMQVQDPRHSRTPEMHARRMRADSEESTSWLDTIDESAGSSHSSVHSRSSQDHSRRRRRIRVASGATEAEFDAALDAAVEAAYGEGLEPAGEDEDLGTMRASADVGAPVMAEAVNRARSASRDIPGSDVQDPRLALATARMNVEWAKEHVRSAEREAAMQLSKERQKQRLQRAYSHDRSESFDLEYDDDEAEEEERMLEEMTRGYVMDDSEYDLQSKSALPRQSDSSGFSGRTWGSSIGSDPRSATAATSLQTLPEAGLVPSLPPLRGMKPLTPPSVALPMPPSPPPPPTQAPPRPPSPSTTTTTTTTTTTAAMLSPPTVRTRRLSARLSGSNVTHTPLKIETSTQLATAVPALTSGADSPTRRAGSVTHSPSPPKALVGVHGHPPRAGSLSRAPGATMSHGNSRSRSSPMAADPTVVLLTSMALHKTISQDSNGGVHGVGPPSSPGGRKSKGSRGTDYLRKIQSSSSLKSRSFNISSPDESDPSPSTPLGASFGYAATSTAGQAKSGLSSVPALPTPSANSFTSNGLPTGGLSLFDSDIHSPTQAGWPNPLAANGPAPLEPCPTEVILRPFWLMRCLYQTITHPRGGYLSTRLFVPADVWRVKAVKLRSVEEKVSQCDLLTAALLKLGRVDSCDADAVLEEMQCFEVILDQVQASLSKKLGNDVGLQGSSAFIRDALPSDGASDGSHGDHGLMKLSGNKSFSWKRLRSKTSGREPALPSSTNSSNPNLHSSTIATTTSPSSSFSTANTASIATTSTSTITSPTAATATATNKPTSNITNTTTVPTTSADLNTSTSSNTNNAPQMAHQAKDPLSMATLPMAPMSSSSSLNPHRSLPKRDLAQVPFTGPNATYMSALARLFDAAQALDQIARQTEDPGLKHSSPTHVGLELSTRHAAEFFGFYVCRFALADMGLMLDKFIKRGSEWVLV